MLIIQDRNLTSHTHNRSTAAAGGPLHLDSFFGAGRIRTMTRLCFVHWLLPGSWLKAGATQQGQQALELALDRSLLCGGISPPVEHRQERAEAKQR